MEIVTAGLGAILGAVIRYAITNCGKKNWPKNFPYATLLINLTGAFLLGFIFALKLPVFIYAFLGTGILGGYTTFSTLNVELLGKLKAKNYSVFWIYLIASYLGGLVLVFIGFAIGKVF
ncbi:fluoride efflux transporter CrcB [Lactobacillus hamsteri]|uniref:Fluoride-specific ion channel FluC n=1 Tax=Lactobacillus hamsteri DSM 5661 = JCM 6256 TaxID=1423754 RepID=A0A0R1YA88_9LACO|nr:fluoride efflux transporter CrcB [Lactobacillus hamsteri]KRM38853.1 camphor resistance protein CrcB [Lactobacillus hamsteri DSM 5661 = JCM 6256]